MAYVYMARCADDSIYTGIAKDLGHRMREHYYRKKNGAKYTKSRRLAALEMVWETEEWSMAARLEFQIKRLTRSRKLELIREPERLGELVRNGEDSAVYRAHPDWTLEMFLEEPRGERAADTGGGAHGQA
ncbi:MAG: GIY-YIG nuclease family protein [Eubacteriales bacterium]|nr:GIY-YIG nuclease family protein [Eubacteriales bacterium]